VNRVEKIKSIAVEVAKKVWEDVKENLSKGIIEWPDYDGKEKDIVWKFPIEEIPWGAVLIVHEFEVAAFFRDGKMYDIFTAGRHVLTSANLPLLTRAFKSIYGGKTPIISTIFFVSTREFVGQFGTRSQTRELFPIVTNGQYWYKISDPTLFVNEVVGGNKRFTTEEVTDFVRGFVNQNIAKELSKYDLATIFTEGLDAISARTKVAIEDKFARFGIDLLDLKINYLDTTEEYRNYAVMLRQGVAPAEVLRMWTIRESAKELGKSPGAAIGAGLVLPQMLAQPPAQPQQPAAMAQATEDPLKLLQLRFVRGEITKDQYEEMRRVLEGEIEPKSGAPKKSKQSKTKRGKK